MHQPGLQGTRSNSNSLMTWISVAWSLQQWRADSTEWNTTLCICSNLNCVLHQSFFKRFQLFGLACFCRTAASAEERGARMRSVGVLMKHYASLGAHYPFLTEAASALNDNPGDFHRLLEYYQGHQRDVQVSHKALRSTNINRSTFFNWTKEFGLHTGSINRFYSRYGVGLFTVWKVRGEWTTLTQW